MPEGPSIVILREEAAKFAGKVVREVGGNSRQDIQRMAGKRVRALCSWGKHFLVVFDGFYLRVHFMLFGRYRIDALKENASPRLSLRFDNGELNLYACSVKFVEGDPDATYDWRGDVMADAWDPKLARRKLKDVPHMLAADALLEQDVFAGVGNIIKNEVLWRIRVHPESTIGALPSRKLGELIKQARDYSFDFLEWKKAFVLRKHYQVHTKSVCPRDGNKITWRKQLGEKQRRAFFCDVCQVLYREKELQAPAVAKTVRTAVSKTAAKPPRAAHAKPVAKKAVAKKAVAKKAVAKPVVAKKAVAKKVVAKKAVAKAAARGAGTTARKAARTTSVRDARPRRAPARAAAGTARSRR
jgi:endonuclease-8